MAKLAAAAPAGGRAVAVPGPARLHTRAFVKAAGRLQRCLRLLYRPAHARTRARAHARTRGREASRSIEAVSGDIAAALARGAREVVITGTQLGAWGRDRSEPLAPRDLIAGVLARTEVPRLRFSSAPAPGHHPPAARALGGSPPDALLPPRPPVGQPTRCLRACAAATTAPATGPRSRAFARLSRMRRSRRTSSPAFLARAKPTSHATLDLCEDLGLARVHAFPYSPRARTAAASLTAQVPVSTRKARDGAPPRTRGPAGGNLPGAVRRHAAPVLWEAQRTTPEGPRWHGLTDNYLSVYAQSPEPLAGRITPAALGGRSRMAFLRRSEARGESRGARLLFLFGAFGIAAATSLIILAWNSDEMIRVDVKDFTLQAFVEVGDAERWGMTLVVGALALVGVAALLIAVLPERPRVGRGLLRLRQSDGGVGRGLERRARGAPSSTS